MRFSSEKSGDSKQSNSKSTPSVAYSASILTRKKSQSRPSRESRPDSDSFAARGVIADVKTEAPKPPVMSALFAAASAQSMPLKPTFVRTCA